MVRRVRSGRRLPRGAPRGWSISPAGPSASNFFFQPYKVCLHMPTRAAKSRAGRPLRCQVSKSNSRCSTVRETCLACSLWTNRRPPLFRPDKRGRPAWETSTSSSVKGVSPTSVTSPSPHGPAAETVGGGAAGEVAAPLRSPSLRSGSLRSAPTSPAAPGCCSPEKSAAFSLFEFSNSSDMWSSLSRVAPLVGRRHFL